MKIFSIIKPVSAQITQPVIPEFNDMTGTQIVGNIISVVIGVFAVAGFIFALLHLVFGAITWITSSGDKGKLENARERITQALVGLIILASIIAIAKLVSTITGIGDFPFFDLPSVTSVGDQ